MKNQVLFSLKDKSNKLNCCLLQFLCGALRVKRLCIYRHSLVKLSGLSFNDPAIRGSSPA